MNCRRCQQLIRECPDKAPMGSCPYLLCKGSVHVATGKHACEDKGGEAESALLLPLPSRELETRAAA